MRRALVLAALGLTSAAGAPAQARQWSEPAPVPGSYGAGYPYDVAVASDGTAAVAFVRDGIRVAIRLANGAWSRATKVSTSSKAVATPDVAVDGAGEVLVAWTQSRVTGSAPIGRNSVRLAIRAANGRWGAPKTVGATEHFIDAELQLRANRRGDAVLGWRGVNRRGRDLLQAAFRPARRAFGGAHSLGEAGFDLRVAIAGRGAAYAAWTHLSPPSYVRSSVRLAVRGRRRWSRPATVAAGDAGGPQLALAPQRRVLIAWREAEQGLGATRTGLAAVTERSPDGRLAPSRLLADNRTPGPQVAVGPLGERLVVWADAVAVDEPAPAALSWAVGSGDGTFGFPQRRVGVGSGPLVMLGDGTAIVVWGTGTVQAVVRPPGGIFGKPQVLAPRGSFPVIGGGTRSAVAVWLSGGRLMAARRQARG